MYAAMGCNSDSDPRGRFEECGERNRPTQIPPEELAAWNIVGPGKTRVVETETGRAVEFQGKRESPNSIVLLSPSRYAENSVLRFGIQFKLPRSLAVIILSASTPETGAELSLPDRAPGWGFWDNNSKRKYRGGIGAQSYLFSIHAAFHQRDALLRRRPGPRDGSLHATPDTLTEEGQWYSVEVGRRGDSIWLKSNGESLLLGTDPDPLPGGHIGFLFTGKGDATVLIRNVSVLGCPIE